MVRVYVAGCSHKAQMDMYRISHESHGISDSAPSANLTSNELLYFVDPTTELLQEVCPLYCYGWPISSLARAS